MKAVIMAGGKGTRISSVAADIPKPMIRIADRPVLEHQIRCLKEQGLTDITLITGHLGHVIRDYFGDGGKWGVSLSYYQEEEPLGTAGALYYFKDVLREDFLLMNGDIMVDIDFSRLIRFHREKGARATLLTHPNHHPYDSALIVADAGGKVTRWIHKEETRTRYKNRVNAGIHIISPVLLENIKKPGKLDLDRDILKPLVKEGTVYAYDSPEYVKDMGTPERYKMVCEDYESGKITARNLVREQKAVFLDRDGTLNKYIGFLTRPEQLQLLEGAAEAVKKINESGYLAVVVTNQPVIARGECSLEELEEIHKQLETELGNRGAYVDDIFFCPHHPDKGFEGERPEYKIDCECRKPKPGMLRMAARKYHIDLKNSYMVGDSMRDVQAGLAAGCRSVYVGKESDFRRNETARDVEIYPDLLSFVKDKIE